MRFCVPFGTFLYPKPDGFQSVPRVAPLSTVGVATLRKTRPRAVSSRAREKKCTPFHWSGSCTRKPRGLGRNLRSGGTRIPPIRLINDDTEIVILYVFYGISAWRSQAVPNVSAVFIKLWCVYAMGVIYLFIDRLTDRSRRVFRNRTWLRLDNWICYSTIVSYFGLHKCIAECVIGF